MTIVILGWGSLIWDTDTEKGKEFDRWHGEWEKAKGLELPLEFSRISESRKKALTLVIDTKNGTQCCVRYTKSKRQELNDAICDLRCREGTSCKNIGYWPVDGNSSKHEATERIGSWARNMNFDAVVWTALKSNFCNCRQEEFTVENAIQHIKKLSREGKLEAAKYVWRAPEEIRTKLRKELETEPWFG